MDADEAVTNRFVDRQKRLADAAGFRLAKAWDSLDSYDAGDVDTLEEAAGQAITAAQIQSVALTAAYISTVTGEPVASTDPDTVPNWRDPFIAYWRALKMGESWDAAKASGRSRAFYTGSDAVIRASDDFYKSQ